MTAPRWMVSIQPGERVCVLADTRPEWSIAAYALWSAGAVVVPIYPSNSPEECAWVAANSGAVAVIVEDAVQLAKLDAVRGALPALRSIFVFDVQAATEGVLAVEHVAASGGDREELSRRREAVAPDDPALVIFTSGTTGPPKGCLLSHRNAMSLCSIVLEVETLLPGEVAYLYLPLAHVFAQIVQLAAFQVGAAIAYYGGDTKQIIAELMEVHPDYLPSVPRVFEKLYALAIAGPPRSAGRRPARGAAWRAGPRAAGSRRAHARSAARAVRPCRRTPLLQGSSSFRR
ncbi:MAG: AMP-binding protein [Solirubrobacteraceae bacterium]